MAVLDEAIAAMRLRLNQPDAHDLAFGAADRLVKLLERRSKLLGLDAPADASEAGGKPGTLAAVERRLGVVQGGGKG